MMAKTSKSPLFTIGYEQAKADAVLGELKAAKVELLVDVRAVAASRRPGFSKRQLAADLDEHGIGYLHLRGLGTPKEGRLAARSGDLKTLWRIFEKHLKTPQAKEELDELDAHRADPAGACACSATSATWITATAAASRKLFTSAQASKWKTWSAPLF